MPDLNGKAALVTGAAQGIGRGIAERLARAGASVTLLDIDASALDETVGVMSRAGYNANAVCGDTTSRSDLAKALLVAGGDAGALDIVVAQAGIADIRDFALIDDADWQRMLDVNVTGAFRCIQESTALMPSGAAVVLLASTNASFPEAHTVHYSTSKGAVVAFARAASLDLAPRGIRVNVICPGIIDTRLAAVLTQDPVAGPAYLRRVPLGRWGEPGDIGDAAVFLASSEASYITGQVLTVDGGATVGVALDVQDRELPGFHGAPEAS